MMATWHRPPLVRLASGGAPLRMRVGTITPIVSMGSQTPKRSAYPWLEPLSLSPMHMPHTHVHMHARAARAHACACSMCTFPTFASLCVPSAASAATPMGARALGAALRKSALETRRATPGITVTCALHRLRIRRRRRPRPSRRRHRIARGNFLSSRRARIRVQIGTSASNTSTRRMASTFSADGPRG